MENRTYAYARISSKDQNEARQIKAFIEAGVNEREIYVDKQSGKDFNRDKYEAVINSLRKGDTFIIKSIDRLGRNYTEIKNEWKRITKEIRSHIKVLDMPLLDTEHQVDDITKELIADIVLRVLAYVAEQEVKFIKQRQAEGIASMPIVGGKKVSLKTGRCAIPVSIDNKSTQKRQ